MTVPCSLIFNCPLGLLRLIHQHWARRGQQCQEQGKVKVKMWVGLGEKQADRTTRRRKTHPETPSAVGGINRSRLALP